MIVYGSGISDGDRHNHDDLPILLAGKGGGTITPGRHVRYDSVPLNNLYLVDARPDGRPGRSAWRQHRAAGDALGLIRAPPQTSSPIARIRARALLCWTTPGRIR